MTVTFNNVNYGAVSSSTINTGTITTHYLHNEDEVLVSKGEYGDLQDDSKLLWALIEAGVEEWEGYDKAVLML